MAQDSPAVDSIRNVLIAVDLTPRSELVIRSVRRVVPDRSARRVLMHVVRDLGSLLDVYASGSPVEPLQADIQARAEARLEELRAEFLADYPEATVELRKGQIWSEIVAAAIASRADLAFLGAHFSDDPEHMVVAGDIVARVTKIAPCPVVVVPSE